MKGYIYYAKCLIMVVLLVGMVGCAATKGIEQYKSSNINGVYDKAVSAIKRLGWRIDNSSQIKVKISEKLRSYVTDFC